MSPPEAATFTERMKQPFECLVDPDRSAYRAFVLARGTPSQLYGPGWPGRSYGHR